MVCGFFKPKFHAKCKSLIKLTKMQLEFVREKENVICKNFKYDTIWLLASCFDDFAYERVGWLLVESMRLSAYDSMEQFLDCIKSHLPLFQKQHSQCPAECREAVSSLIYAAARVSGVPALRKLRSLFTKRYGISIASSPKQEFIEKFKSEPPSKDVKLQLLHDIAQEFSMEWDSKDLEQRLFNPPPINQGEANNRGRLQREHANSESVVPAKRMVPSGGPEVTSTTASATKGKLPEHVHPKLPDYDALVAYFTALKEEMMKGCSKH